MAEGGTSLVKADNLDRSMTHAAQTEEGPARIDQVDAVTDADADPARQTGDMKPNAGQHREPDEDRSHDIVPSENQISNVRKQFEQMALNDVMPPMSQQVDAVPRASHVEHHQTRHLEMHGAPGPRGYIQNLEGNFNKALIAPGANISGLNITHQYYGNEEHDALDSAPHRHHRITDARLDREYRHLLGCDRQITSEEINSLSEKIGIDWKRLGRKLGFERGKLDALKYDNESEGLSEIVHALLSSWREWKASEATVSVFTKAILGLNLDDTDYARNILDTFDQNEETEH